MLELTIRLVLSLAAVVGLLLLCARLAGRRFQSGRDSLVHIVHRQPLSRAASVSVVTIGRRVLVLGTTEQQVRLLVELDPAELDELGEPVGRRPDPAVIDSERIDLVRTDLVHPDLVRTDLVRTDLVGAVRQRPRSSVPAGSVLSPRTWRQAWSVITGRAS